LKIKRKKNYKKIGILGGTFDPPHKGHLYISKIVIKKLRLTKLMWIVTKKNPLKKKPYLDKETRIKLSKNITKKEKKIFVKYLDDKIKSSNTFDLLKYINKKNKSAKLFFLIGADNLMNFHRWKNWLKITKLAKIVIFPRQNYSFKSLNKKIYTKIKQKDLIYIKSKKINISSSLIKKIW